MLRNATKITKGAIMFNKKEFNAELARNGLTREDLAKTLGITPSTLWRKVESFGNFKRSEIQIMISLFGLEAVSNFLFSDSVAKCDKDI